MIFSIRITTCYSKSFIKTTNDLGALYFGENVEKQRRKTATVSEKLKSQYKNLGRQIQAKLYKERLRQYSSA